MPRILLKERGAFGNASTSGAWLLSACATTGDKLEEGEDDVKSSCPLCLGRHTYYNGWNKGSRSREIELTPKTCPQFGLPVINVRKFFVELHAYLKTNKPQFKEIISSTKTFTGEAEALLKEAIEEQMKLFLLQEQASCSLHRTEDAFLELAHPRGIAILSPIHCSTCVAQGIRGMMT
ncbi:hypothetical protein VNO78_32166 [Psophocarpus tetragonolobus]|uniref:Uncharacterized protein n=1 Tax=Psophocarpus tetragonolobus TaxID=3891 RepID=A0AAN9RZ18_PSOTE